METVIVKVVCTMTLNANVWAELQGLLADRGQDLESLVTEMVEQFVETWREPSSG
jgi:hypothetical protein